MKKYRLFSIIAICFMMILTGSFLFACGDDNSSPPDTTPSINFIVDNAKYHTIKTNGNELVSLPTDPVKEGYIFEGWFLDKDVWDYEFTGDMYLNKELTSSINVYAKLTHPTELFIVSFSNEFTEINKSTYSVTVSNDTESYNLNTNMRIFTTHSWVVKKASEGTELNKEALPLDLGDNEFTLTFTNDYENTKDITLIIRRRPKYTVTFNVDNEQIDSQVVEEGLFATSPLTDSYADVGYEISWDYDLSQPIMEDTNINAIYTPINYTITYHLDDGVNASNNPTTYTIESDTITLGYPSKENHLFRGWYTDENFTDEVTEITTGSYGDLELYAKFIVDYELTFNFEGGAITGLTNFGKTLSEIEIPTYMGSQKVTSIAEYAFENCTNIKSLIVPNNVTSIGFSALSGCTNLTNITLPFVGNGSSKTHFSYLFGVDYENYSDAYYVPTSVKKVTITGEVAIEENAFEDCTSITTIIIGDSVTSIERGAFWGCTGLTSVTIGEGVESIGVNAFFGCMSLKNVIMGEGVTTIGGNAFRRCTSLQNINIGNSVTNIESAAFYDCENLISVTIPSSVTSIKGSAFYGCQKLTEVYASSIESWCNIYFGDPYANPLYPATYLSDTYLYIDNQLVTEITIPSSVTSLKRYAFYNCQQLTSVVIENSVESIGAYTFGGCINLTAVYYKGTSEDWAEISIDSESFYRIVEKIYYYSEQTPSASGNFWHYVDGVPTIWVKEN